MLFQRHLQKPVGLRPGRSSRLFRVPTINSLHSIVRSFFFRGVHFEPKIRWNIGFEIFQTWDKNERGLCKGSMHYSHKWCGELCNLHRRFLTGMFRCARNIATAECQFQLMWLLAVHFDWYSELN